MITRRIIGFAVAVAAAAAVSAPAQAAAQPAPPAQAPQAEQLAGALQNVLSQGERRQLADELGKDFLDDLRRLSAEEVVALLSPRTRSASPRSSTWSARPPSRVARPAPVGRPARPAGRCPPDRRTLHARTALHPGTRGPAPSLDRPLEEDPDCASAVPSRAAGAGRRGGRGQPGGRRGTWPRRHALRARPGRVHPQPPRAGPVRPAGVDQRGVAGQRAGQRGGGRNPELAPGRRAGQPGRLGRHRPAPRAASGADRRRPGGPVAPRDSRGPAPCALVDRPGRAPNRAVS
jgi:hypothetical protein